MERPDDHKQLVAGIFDRASPLYDRVGDRVFAAQGRRLVELAGVAPGDRVLDVATGTGAVLCAAARAAAPGGHAIGIDLAPGMVREARAALEREGLPNAEAREGDGEALDFADASFDRVLCGFSLFFFPSPERALGGFVRVLAPGGTLAVSSWRFRDPRWAWWPELVKEHGVAPRQLMTRSFDEPADLEAALAAAGLRDVRVVAEDVALSMRDPDEWWASLWTAGQRAQLEQMDEATLARFKRAALARVEELREDGLITRRAQALFALGRAP